MLLQIPPRDQVKKKQIFCCNLNKNPNTVYLINEWAKQSSPRSFVKIAFFCYAVSQAVDLSKGQLSTWNDTVKGPSEKQQ